MRTEVPPFPSVDDIGEPRQELPAARGNPAGGDPFLEEFFARIPERTAPTFSPEQLVAIKMAFGARTWGMHSIDLRLSIPLVWRRFYVVLLMGPERRSPKRRDDDRKRYPLTTLGSVFAGLLLVAIIITPLALAAYGLKTAFGINILSTGGVHAAVDALRQQLILLLR